MHNGQNDVTLIAASPQTTLFRKRSRIGHTCEHIVRISSIIIHELLIRCVLPGAVYEELELRRMYRKEGSAEEERV